MTIKTNLTFKKTEVVTRKAGKQGKITNVHPAVVQKEGNLRDKR